MFSLMGTWVMLITLLIHVNLWKHGTSDQLRTPKPDSDSDSDSDGVGVRVVKMKFFGVGIGIAGKFFSESESESLREISFRGLGTTFICSDSY